MQRIDQIAKPYTKYYELKKYFIDKQHFVYYQRSETSGKNNEYLTFYIDVACPILVDSLKADTIIALNVANGKKPLIVIDGRIDSSRTQISTLKRADVKIIYALKSAEAIAIYGSAAKDGALIINTVYGAIGNTNFLSLHMPKAWLCLEFKKELSNNLSQDEKESEYKEFDSVTNIEFKERNLNEFVYLDRIGVNDRRKAYLKAIQSKIDTAKKPVILEAVNEPFEARNGDKFEWIYRSFGIGAALWLLMIMIPKLNTLEIEKLPENPLQSNLDTIYKSLSVFKPSSPYQITAIIIAINLAVFIIMVFAGGLS